MGNVVDTFRERYINPVATAVATPVGSLLAFAVFTRVAIVLVAALAGSYFPFDGWNRGPGFIQYFARWDSGFYMDIAEFGYGFKPEAWSFNPGYPLLIALVWRVIPGVDLPTAGFLVSNAAFLIAIVLFYKLGTRWFSERTAWRSAAFAAAVPGTMYFSAVYAESLFLLLVVGAFLAMDTHRWLTAGGLVGFAAITRPPGLFLGAAMGLAVLIHLFRARRLAWRPILALALAAVPPALFLLFSHSQTGDALISTHSREVYWPNVGWHSPLSLFDLDGVSPPIRALIYGGMALLSATMIFIMVDLGLRRRVEMLPVYAFTFALGIVYLTYSEPNPIVRYLVTLPPLYWLMGTLTWSRGVFAGLVALGSALAAVVTVIFATWGPLY